MKIMIVDDSQTARLVSKKVIKMVFGSEEIEFSEAVNGTDALEKLELEIVDIIISDINMPEMTGFTLLKNIKINKKLSKIPIIFVTSFSNDARVDNLMELGAVGVLPKPLKVKQLSSLLERLKLKSVDESSGAWGK
ncbi:MAG: response regulator [Bacteriovoracaceae bacterium]|nr:response regulator [Bacteriovoracaceae bacterium]